MAAIDASVARDAVAAPRLVREAARTRIAPVAWNRWALGLIVLLSGFLNFFQLGAGGFANAYYAASVRSTLDSWHNFFFVAFDPGGFVTIDKPPVGFWLQAASAKLLGFSSFSILLPQAISGVLSVLLLYHLVRRHFGVVAGLLAALALAVSPISVVTNRNNTIDSTLALVLLLGAWAVMKAAEGGKLRYLLLGAALIGIGFNIKMLEAYLVVPAYAGLYVLAAPHRLPKRVGHLALAGALMLAISLSWVAAVDLTPAALRPWVDSTQNNSELGLALGYNGIDRLLGMFRGGAGAGPVGGASQSNRTVSGTSTTSTSGGSAGQDGQLGGPPGGGPGGSSGMFGTGTPGPLRLFQQSLGGQIGWLLPLAIVGMLTLALRGRLRVARDPRHQSLVVWGGWLVTMGVFFSVAGFFHPYYLTVMAPAVAALVGIGVVLAGKEYRRGGWRSWLLPIAVVATAGEQAYLLSAYPTYSRWLIPVLALFVGLAVVALVGARVGHVVHSMRLSVAVGLAVLALLIAPSIWGAIPVVQGEAQGLPSAGPSQMGGPGGFGGPGSGSGAESSTSSTLASYLEANRNGAAYLVAVPSSQQADSLILTTNQPVMALGGFSGSDPILTTEAFAQLVKDGKVRYALISSDGFGGPGGDQQSSITQWIQAHGTAVPTWQWGGSATGSYGGPGGGETLYQLNVG